MGKFDNASKKGMPRWVHFLAVVVEWERWPPAPGPTPALCIMAGM